MNERFIRAYWVVPAACVLMTSACADSTTSVSVRGYNHMNRLWIYAFNVNGTAGPNVSPHSGGGETCCVVIPERWRPGLKARVVWEYDQHEDATHPLPKNQVAEVEIPEYRHVGAVHVHFYEGHRIKVIVSPCSPRHPFYPLSGQDLAPWTPSGSKEEMREAAERGGGSVEC